MNFLRKIIYRLPILPKLYHYCLAGAGAFFYGFPSRKLFVVGVTGTKGKSTVLELMNAILEAAGKKTALLSSIRVKVGDWSQDNPTETTMPGRFFIQRFLRQAVEAGCQYALVEVTSQGVVLNRHRFIDWDAAVFLNLHPEHIEAHGSFEAYRNAKLDFFQYVGHRMSPISGHRKAEGLAMSDPAKRDFAEGERTSDVPKLKLFLINKDDPNANHFAATTYGSAIFFSKSNLPSQLAGDFNKYNVGAAVAFAQSQGITGDVIQKAVADFAGVPGRMEFVQQEPFRVVIDYAHTPDSLHFVYQTLKKKEAGIKNQGKLICVLGSAGGGRDKWKRSEMGKIAAEHCDEIIITNEDPYDEEPEAIINEIARACPKAQKVLDRREAIKKAVSLAQAGDTVVITGKGSEKFIHIANSKKISWSDRETTLAILKEKM